MTVITTTCVFGGIFRFFWVVVLLFLVVFFCVFCVVLFLGVGRVGAEAGVGVGCGGGGIMVLLGLKQNLKNNLFCIGFFCGVFIFFFLLFFSFFFLKPQTQQHKQHKQDIHPISLGSVCTELLNQRNVSSEQLEPGLDVNSENLHTRGLQ